MENEDAIGFTNIQNERILKTLRHARIDRAGEKGRGLVAVLDLKL